MIHKLFKDMFIGRYIIYTLHSGLDRPLLRMYSEPLERSKPLADIILVFYDLTPVVGIRCYLTWLVAAAVYSDSYKNIFNIIQHK